MGGYAVFLVLISSFAWLSHSLVIEVLPKEEECFIEYIKTKRTASLNIAVLQGGSNLDIRLKAFGPFEVSPQAHQMEQQFFNQLISTKVVEGSNDVLHDGFNFDTEHRGGYYRYCLDNSHSTWSAKIVDFTTRYGLTTVGDVSHEDVTEDSRKKGHVDNMHQSLTSLQELLYKIKSEQNYFRTREYRHMITLKSNQTRIFWYTAIEFIGLGAMSAVQAYLLNQWFSTPLSHKTQWA